MSLIRDKFDLYRPLPDILLKEWRDKLQGCEAVIFNNLDHFKHIVSKLSQKEDNKCGVSYEKAVEMLVRNETDFPKEEQESIRNLVRENLFKRGLITEEVYENFRYSTDGTQVGVDVGKYAAGEPDCVMTPSRQYIDYFYELYISISYPWNIENSTVRKNIAKLLATVEELERKHIFIKINVIWPCDHPKIDSADTETNKFFGMIPVFSHKDRKSVETMSAVVNDRLLRKFFFAILEDVYGDNLVSCYGYANDDFKKAMNVGYDFDEVELFQGIESETIGLQHG